MRVSTIALVCVLVLCSFVMCGSGQFDYEDVFEKTSNGIRLVTPGVSQERADRLSVWIVSAAEENEIDPLLVVAMIRRESNFMSKVERGELRGKRGEIGLLQAHGVSLRYRPQWCPRNLLVWRMIRGEKILAVDDSAHCQIYTGVNFLAWVRDYCGGSKSRWVASYGMSKCATEDQAPDMISVKRARRYYFQAGGDDWI